MKTETHTINGKEYSELRFESGDKPLYIDPCSVGCGFLHFSKSAGKIIEEHLHQGLATRQTDFWAAVKRKKPSLPVHLLMTNQSPTATDVIIALNQTEKYSDFSYAFDVMKVSPDGGRTVLDIIFGFTYRYPPRQFVMTQPQMILPRAEPQSKQWWQFWK